MDEMNRPVRDAIARADLARVERLRTDAERRAALFDAIDVTELEPWAAMARMSLAIAQGDAE